MPKKKYKNCKLFQFARSLSGSYWLLKKKKKPGYGDLKKNKRLLWTFRSLVTSVVTSKGETQEIKRAGSGSDLTFKALRLEYVGVPHFPSSETQKTIRNQNTKQGKAQL